MDDDDGDQKTKDNSTLAQRKRLKKSGVKEQSQAPNDSMTRTFHRKTRIM